MLIFWEEITDYIESETDGGKLSTRQTTVLTCPVLIIFQISETKVLLEWCVTHDWQVQFYNKKPIGYFQIVAYKQ